MPKTIRKNTRTAPTTDDSETATGGRGRRREWSDDPAENFRLWCEGWQRENPSDKGPKMLTVPGIVAKVTALARDIERTASDRATFDYEEELGAALADHLRGIMEPALAALGERPSRPTVARGFKLSNLQ